MGGDEARGQEGKGYVFNRTVRLALPAAPQLCAALVRGARGRRAPSPGGCHLAPQSITCTSAEGGQGASTGAEQKPKGAPGSSDFSLAREAPSPGDPEPLSGQPEGILGVLRGCCGSSS